MGSYLNEYLNKKYKIYGVSRIEDKKKRIYSYDQLKKLKLSSKQLYIQLELIQKYIQGFRIMMCIKKTLKFIKKQLI